MKIWFALIAAPILALMDQAVAYATVRWACGHQQPIALHAVHICFLVVNAACAFPAWHLWRQTRIGKSGNEALAGRHFLAGLAIAVSSLSMLVIASMWMPVWIIPVCSN